MSLIYILLGDGQQVPCEEAQVREMLGRGEVTLETYFWREGMVDWRPLSELSLKQTTTVAPPRRTADMASRNPVQTFRQISTQSVAPASSGAQTAGPVSRRKSGRRYYFRKNPVPLTICFQIFSVISIGAAAIFVYLCLGKIGVWDNSGGLVPHNGATRSANLTPIAAADKSFLIEYLGILVAGHIAIEILFFYWVYFTNKNCRIFAGNMTFTSGWAVGWFFVPVFNLFRPYQVVQEIWKVSQNPLSWHGRRDSIFVGLWFLVRIGLFFLCYGPYDGAFTPSEEPEVRFFGILLYLATVEGAAIMVEFTTLILVTVVTWRQVRLVKSGV